MARDAVFWEALVDVTRFVFLCEDFYLSFFALVARYGGWTFEYVRLRMGVMEGARIMIVG